MKHNDKIVVCYNSPVSVYSLYSGKEDQQSSVVEDLSESGFSKELDVIVSSLKEKFNRVEILPIDRNVTKTFTRLIAMSPDAVFNFVESVEGIASFEAYNAGMYELLQIPYTGNGPQTLGNCLNKSFAKQILKSYEVNTPKHLVYNNTTPLSCKNFPLQFPVITKLLKEDASIGISENSVACCFDELIKQIDFLSSHFNQEIIIEEYIDGREFNVAVLGNKILPISEIIFDGLPYEFPKIVTYEGKWVAESVYYKFTKPNCPAELSSRLKSVIEKTAITAFNALECRDYARVDIRLDKFNIPYVIEVNPNPDISTDSGFNRAANAAGLSYSQLLYTIASFALERGINDSKNKAV